MEFKFKEFTVNQAASAAKITTDATIFAAWLPLNNQVSNALEIGAGTGVMSLMVAQRSNALIEAVEIDGLAYQEAKQNFTFSPFSKRLKIHHTAIQSYDAGKKYDLIFSNPPFFNNNLLSENNTAKNTAYHTVHLSFTELAVSIDRLLTDNGLAFIMLPVYESKLFDQEIAAFGYHPVEILFISHNAKKKPLRRIVGYGKQKNHLPKTAYINVRNSKGDFDINYKELLSPFLTIF